MEKNNDLMSGKGEKGKWITVRGAHIFVEDGQSVEEAMNKHFDNNGGSKETKTNADKPSSDEKKSEADNKENDGKDIDTNELLKQYQQLTEEQRNKIFTAEQRKVIDAQIFFKKLFEDPSFYKTVEEAIGDVAYDELKTQKDVSSGQKTKRKFKNKKDLIDFIKKQTNIELLDDKTERWNDQPDKLYARIPGKTGYEHKATNPVLSLLNKNGIRHEEHLNNGYWIWLKN